MYQKIVKKVLLGVIAGSLGGLIGKLVGDLIFKETEVIYEEEVEEDPQSVEELGDEELPDDAFVVEGQIIRPEKEKPSSRKRKAGREDGDMVTDYQKYRKVILPLKPPLSELVRKYDNERDLTKPHVITMEEYIDPGKGNQNVILTYFDVDDCLSNLDEKVIDNIDELLGDGLLHFGEGSDDPDTVYVRNPKKGLDYEIARLHKAFSAEVLGLKEIEPPKKRRSKLKEDE